MDITNKIKGLLSLTGKKQLELMTALGMGSKQSLSNKFSNERWSAQDLIVIAKECGCELCFITPDGTKINLTE